MDSCSITAGIKDAVLKEAVDSNLFTSVLSANVDFKTVLSKINLDLPFVNIPEEGKKIKVTSNGKIATRQYTKEELDLEQNLLKTRVEEIQELLNCN